MSEMIRKQFANTEIVKDAAGGDRVRRFVISTGSVDRDNDTISAAGWKLDNYRRNPVVLWAHDYSQLPVAKAISVGVESGKLVATAEFANHPFANTVLQMIDGGFLRATSVGFKATKSIRNDQRGGIDFIEQELLEFSIVPVPANPEAVRQFKRLNLTFDEVVLDVEETEPVYTYEQIATAYGALGTHRRSEPFEPIYDINPAEVRRLLESVVRQAVGDVARGAVKAAFDRARGRVD